MMKGKKLKVMGASTLTVLTMSGLVATPAVFAKAKKAAAPVVLTYSAWGDTPTMQADIKEFNATHPGIQVKLVNNVDSYDTSGLAAAAAAGKFPDITWTRDVPYAVSNGWALDLTPYLKSDPTYKTHSFGNLVANTNYLGHQFALPTQMYITGIAINKTLFEQANIPLPKPTWTVDEFRQDGIKLTDYSKHQFGFMGLNGTGVLDFRNTIIPEFDSKLGEQATKARGGYDFTSGGFAKAQNFVNQILFTDKSDADMYWGNNGETWNQWYGKDKDPWAEGKIAMQYAPSWNFPYLNSLKMDWEILPYPKGTTQRIPLAVEEAIVSRTTKHPKEAVEFLKWMDYSSSGWDWRVTHEDYLNLPTISDSKVWQDVYKEKGAPPGLNNLISYIPTGFLDGTRWYPGFNIVADDAYKYYQEFNDQKAKPEDIASSLQSQANATYSQGYAKLRNGINKYYRH